MSGQLRGSCASQERDYKTYELEMRSWHVSCIPSRTYSLFVCWSKPAYTINAGQRRDQRQSTRHSQREGSKSAPLSMSLLTNMEDLNIRARDHSQPLIDGQDAIISRVGAARNSAEDVVERRIGSKVSLHAILLLRSIPGGHEAFDDSSNLVDWVIHRACVCACAS